MNLVLENLGTTGTPEAVQFYIMAPLAVAAALGMLIVKKAVHSAILMAYVMLSLAFFYIAQDAPFLGIVQIVVYTGAVMMLFLFILMLVGVDSKESLVETIKGIRFVAISASLGIGLLLVALIGKATFGFPKLFSTYVWAFEVVSALLITAALGAMVLAHSQRVTPRATQRELAVRRFRGESLGDAAGKPAPGVFARYNGVDVPALLPDGTPAVESINDTLKARGTIRDPRQYSLNEIANTEGEER
ncbi:MAG: hypothetical protein RL534_168 [Actinomycetota bacterium]